MRIIDLNHEIHPDMPSLYARPQHVFLTTHDNHVPPNPWRWSEKFSTTVDMWIAVLGHLGTHVDAPYHFDPEGKKINEMPIQTFIASTVVLNLTHKKKNEQITAADLEESLKKAGEIINPGDGILLYTGADKFWETDTRMTYHGQQVGISEDAGEWLINKKPKFIGTDTTAFDWPMNGPIHVILLRKHHIVHYECLCNLGEIRKPRVLFIGLPLKLRDGTGSPVRAIAIEDFEMSQI